MKPINSIQSGRPAQALFLPSRSAFKLSDLVKRLVESKKEEAEKSPDKDKESTEAPKPKPPGVPIDRPSKSEPKSAEETAKEKQSFLNAARQNINEEEKKILDKYGGTIIEMDKIPGNETKGYKNQIFINAPKNPEKFVDKDGKPIPPRVVYYFHGNGGQMATNGHEADYIMSQVEKMRANGENVILVVPQDNQGHWKDTQHPDAFKDMQKTVETLMGGKPIKDISISSFSGGYKGVANVLKNLRENADRDPESKKLYKNIRQLGFLDSAYGGAEEFAEWAKDKNHTLFSNYTAKCESGNRMLENAVREARGGDMEGIKITSFNGIHGNAPLAFMDAMKGRASTAGEDIEGVAVAENGPRIPERSPDAMTPEQYRTALRACKSEAEIKALNMDQLAKGNVPDHFRKFQTVKVDKGTFTVEFSVAPHAMAIGRDGDFEEIAPDGYSAAALAASYNCSLPSKWLVEQTEKQPNAQRVHFSHQGEFAQELGLDPSITHGAKTWSADFIIKNNEKIRNWANKKGINMGGLTVGYYKDIVLPEPGVTGNGRLEIFGGIHDDGTRAQPLSGGFHEIGFHDYSGKFRPVSKMIKKNGVAMTAEQASKDAELMADPEIAKLINGMTGKLPSYDYRKDPALSQFVDRMRKGLPAAQVVTTVETPAPVRTAEYPPVQPASSTPETSRRGGSGIPISGGTPSGGSSYSQQPAAQTESAPESAPESAREKIETAISNKVFILGDSLSMGFASYIKGPNVTHIQSKKENDSTGASTIDMLNALKSGVLSQNVTGSTLVIVGGTNDIFGPDSLEGIKKNLNAIYTLAKQKGMKVVAATLPPVAHSDYAKRNWASHKKRYPTFEEYNEDLIKRWKSLNEWIIGRKGIEDSSGRGPDEVVEFHQVLENPDLPGSLTKDNYGEGGIHLKDYSVMGNRLRDAVASLNPAPTVETAQPATQKPKPVEIETPAEIKITGETKADISSAKKPTKDEALGQNAEIRKNVPQYSGLQQVSSPVASLARQLLGSRDFGAIVYFTDGNNDYAAIKEWHPPYDNRNPGKPQNWHHGISVMKKNT